MICAGDQEHHAYLLGWLAHCVQHPERQAEVAVVLQGRKGTGKGALGQMLVRIFRDHALRHPHPPPPVGHLNAHLVDALFLFLDEAVWAGDKQGEGVLKGIITERTVMIEFGVDPFPMPNRLKILMASNNDWVVPASADERRYFVLDVSDHRRNDRAYFNALHAAIAGEELAAFLGHLLSHDLTRFEVRDADRALNSQKLLARIASSGSGTIAPHRGAIPGTGGEDWPPDVAVQALHAAYVEHARDRGERQPDTDAGMAKKLAALLAGAAWCGPSRGSRGTRSSGPRGTSSARWRSTAPRSRPRWGSSRRPTSGRLGRRTRDATGASGAWLDWRPGGWRGAPLAAGETPLQGSGPGRGRPRAPGPENPAFARPGWSGWARGALVAGGEEGAAFRAGDARNKKMAKSRRA